MDSESLQVHIGVASACGRRETNDDFAAAHEDVGNGRATREIVAAIADGISGPGGRFAAETVVRGFIDGYLSQPSTLGVDRASARALAAMNRWVYAQGRQDPALKNAATTFSALVLRGRTAHVVHVGDTRIYRLRDRSLARLTQDHTHDHPDLKHVLHRAVGLEVAVRADYSTHDVKPHDRYLLCSDGVHAVLAHARLKALLEERTAPEDTARRIVEAAAASSQDNMTALVLDAVTVPSADRLDLETTVAALPLLDLPKPGAIVDDFELLEVVSDGRYSRLYRARDTREPREVILKFPHPRVATEAVYRRAFVREAWVASQVHSPYVAEVIELPAGRRTRLYSVMPYYRGETLEQRLKRAPIALETGARIGIELAKAVYALNRRRIIHRDIKPENVMLEAATGGVKLLDLGVARLPGLVADETEDVPGTPSYMAPELFDGQAGDERSDVYALGVTLYRLFSGGPYPYGEVEAFLRPRFAKRAPLSRHRPDLPAWLDAVLARALVVNPAERHGDAMELAFELEHNLAHGTRIVTRHVPLIERNPVRFWQVVSALLLAALLAALVW